MWNCRFQKSHHDYQIPNYVTLYCFMVKQNDRWSEIAISGNQGAES